MDAYSIVKEISGCKSNIERGNFVKNLAEEFASEYGYNLKEQKIKVCPIYGNKNYILCSGKKNPLLITAHYDSYVLNEFGLTTPGANDNGSGVGVVFNVIKHLYDLPVDFAFFGAEEIGSLGAIKYLTKMKNTPRAVVNIDSCGSGLQLEELLIPDSVSVGKPATSQKPLRFTNSIVQINADLNNYYLTAAFERDYLVYRNDPHAIGDHCIFLEAGIPSILIAGKDTWYIHTEEDTIQTINKNFLEKVVTVVVNGSKNLLKEG